MGCQYRKWETDYYGMCVGGGRSVRCCNVVVGGEFLTIMGYQIGGGRRVVIMGCLWGMGMSIMGCEAEVLGGVLIMGWPWGRRGDELLWDVSIRGQE